MRIKTIQSILLITALAPAVVLAARAVGQSLGDNPAEAITYETGDWAILLLAATLAITPLRRFTGNNNLISFRRMLGLLTFFYAFLHFGIYLLDKRLHWSVILTDIPKRPFITAGFGAFVLMIPLAITSNTAAIRRLGKRWTKVHQWVYVVAVVSVVHYIWMRPHEAKPYLYAALFSTLLLARLWRKGKNRGEETDWRGHGRNLYTYRPL